MDPELYKLGMLRMTRDAFQIPGKITLDQSGNLLKIRFNIDHVLSPGFVIAFRILLAPSYLSFYLGKNRQGLANPDAA